MIWNAIHILWLLPLASLPVVIYYWMRRHPLTYQWGAQYVLDQALRKLKRKLLNEHVILLALRVLLALALLLAFARPALSGRPADRLEHSGIHRVVLLDASYSMLAGDTGNTRWDAALRALEALLTTWGRGETWSLYVMDDTPGWRVEFATVGQTEAIWPEIAARLRPSERPAAIGQALQDIGGRFALPDIELILLCDDQALTWRDIAADGAVDTLRRGYWLNPPILSHANSTVASVSLSSERPLVGHPFRVFAEVRHFAEDGRDVRLEFLHNGQVVGERRVSLLPGLSERVFFDMQVETPGSHAVTVRLDPDVLTYDDVMSAGLEAVESIAVLVLVDNSAGRPLSTALVFTEFGYMQTDLGVKGRLAFSIHDGDCTAKTFAGQDVVFVDANRPVDRRLAALLSDFIAAGGGVVLSPGFGTDRAAWNRHFGQTEWFPARLGDNPVWTFDPDTVHYRRLGSHEFGNDTLRAFATQEAGRPGEVRIFHWFELLVDSDTFDPGDILMRFDDHRPFILRKRFGNGQCILLASGLNGLDNTLPVREIYPALLYRVFGDAASGRIESRSASTDVTLRSRLGQPGPVDAAMLVFEGEEAKPMALREIAGEHLAVLSEGVPRSGLATIQWSQGPRLVEQLVGIQGARAESDLRPVDSDTRALLRERLTITEVGDADALIHALLSGHHGTDLYPWVLAGGLLLLLGELAYQRRFTKVIL